MCFTSEAAKPPIFPAVAALFPNCLYGPLASEVVVFLQTYSRLAACTQAQAPPTTSAIKKTTKLQAQNSRMAAHHIAKYIRHAPVSKPHVDPKVKWGAKFLGATMWFYIFYRVKEDLIGGHH